MQHALIVIFELSHFNQNRPHRLETMDEVLPSERRSFLEFQCIQWSGMEWMSWHWRPQLASVISGSICYTDSQRLLGDSALLVIGCILVLMGIPLGCALEIPSMLSISHLEEDIDMFKVKAYWSKVKLLLTISCHFSDSPFIS